MYKVLVCDDEGIVIESLKYILEKEFGDNIELYTAKNGRQGIERAENNRPDLIIMDISMPGINGIEAMNQIRMYNKDVIFIVLTAYNDFDYSKKCIEIGVFNYITKPIKKDVIIETVNKALDKIKADKESKVKNLELKEKMETVIPILENGYIYNSLLSCNMSASEIENYKNLLDIKQEFSYAIVIEFGDYIINGQMENKVGASVRFSKHYLYFRKLVKEFTNGIIGNLMSNIVVVIVPIESKDNSYNRRIEIIDKVRSLIKILEKDIDMKFKVGIGSVRDFTDMEESYNEAIRSLNTGNMKVNHISDIEYYMDERIVKNQELEIKLIKSIEMCNDDQAVVTLSRIIDDYKNMYPVLNNKVKMYFIELILKIVSLGSRELQFLLKSQDTNILSDVNSIDLYDEFYLVGRRYIITVINDRREKKDNVLDNIVNNAKIYMEENFKKTITLEKTAIKVGVSPYYLSKIFKDKIGENYIDYLTNLRINYGKKEILYSDKSIKEIAIECGYSDANYFSRIFKKITGISPTSYRDGGNNE